MLTATQVAEFFLNKDKDYKEFNTKTITRAGRTFYVGNARLNKYLHLAENLYIAKTGKLLFSDSLYAYDNGGVVKNVQQGYANLLSNHYDIKSIPDTITEFLDKFYTMFKNATLNELIQLSHEDIAWKEKHFYTDERQRMDSLEHKDEYVEQYADTLALLDKIGEPNNEKCIVINKVKFYYSDDIELTEELMKELTKYSIDSDDDAYSFYYDDGVLVVY